MNILITGGAGFIGSHLAAYIARKPNRSITILDNLYRGREQQLALNHDKLAIIRGDIRDRELLSGLMADVDVVFHLAAQSNVIGATLDLNYSFSTNVIGTFNVLAVAVSSGVKRVIFASSREVYGEQEHLPVAERTEMKPKNAYGVSKMVGEAYCRVFRSMGLPVTILRLANVYGPGDRERVIPIFIENALCGDPLVLYGGDQVLDFVWIGTVVEALEQAMETDPLDDPVNIGSGIGISVRELAEIIIQRTESKSAIVNAPSRSCETRGFIADVRNAIKLGLIPRPEGTLQGLDSVIDDSRAQLSPISLEAH